MQVKKLSHSTPFLFYSVVAAGLLGLFSLWFFLHPNSPWHSRNQYIIAFEEIGDLQVGNNVNVNGLPNGKVVGFELHETRILTRVAVYSNVKIPRNSKWKVENAGLMGERVVNILLGNSKDVIQDGEYVIGSFDKSGTTIGGLAVDVLKEAGSLTDVIGEITDSLFSDEKIAGYKKIASKGKRIGGGLTVLAETARDSVLRLFDSLESSQERILQIIDSINPNIDGTIENFEQVKKDLGNLEKSLQKIQKSVGHIAEKMESDGNTIGLILKEDDVLRERLKKISGDAENLMKKINKNGLDLNVCIFWCN